MNAAGAIRDYVTPHRTLLVTVRLKWNLGQLFRYRRGNEPFQLFRSSGIRPLSAGFTQ